MGHRGLLTELVEMPDGLHCYYQPWEIAYREER